jgi:hypothetical protein
MTGLKSRSSIVVNSPPLKSPGFPGGGKNEFWGYRFGTCRWVEPFSNEMTAKEKNVFSGHLA